MALTKVTGHVIKTDTNVHTHNINSTGIITAVSASFSGNVSVGGTLTYQDVTNTDSVGIITAQAGVHFGVGATVGKVDAATGITTFSSSVGIADSIHHIGNTDTSIRFPSADIFTTEIGGSEKFRVNSDGTITQGTIQVDGAEGGSAQIRLRADEGDDSNDMFRFLVEDGGNGLKIDGYDGSFRTRLTVDTAGKVGIGLTTPSNALDVQAGTTNTAIVARSTDAKAQISLLDNTTTGVGCVVLGAEGDNLFLTSGSGGAEALRINSSGQVSIGSTIVRSAGGVSAQLQVEGTSYNTASATFISNAGASAGNQSHITLAKSRGSSDGSNTILADDDSIGLIQWAGADGNDLVCVAAEIRAKVNGTPGTDNMPGELVFGTTAESGTAPTERLTISSTGLVTQKSTWTNTYIGTATTQCGYQVQNLSNTTNTYSALRLTSGNSSPATAQLSSIRTGAGQNDFTIQLETSNTAFEALRIDSSGRIGIGTDNPQRNVHIHQPTAANSYLHMTNSTTGATTTDGFSLYVATDGQTYYRARETTGQHVFYTGTTEKFRIDEDGKVGVGVDDPSLALLHIAPADYSLNLQNNSSNESKIIFTKNGTPNDARSWIKANGEINGYLIFGAGDADRLTIQSTGQLLYSAASGDNQITSKRTNTAGSDGNYFFHLKANNNDDDEVGALGFHRDTAADNSRFIVKTRNASGSSQERFRITSGGYAKFSGPWMEGGASGTAQAGSTDTRWNGGNVDVTDDSSLTFTHAANTGLLVCVGSYRRDGGSITYASALFFITYGSTTITKVSDPRNIFDVSDTDGKVCVLKASASNGTFTVKNRIGQTNKISVNLLHLQGL